MSAQGITGALLAGLSAVNDQKAWENQTAKDKVEYDNTRSSTALNKQSLGHKEKINPFLVSGQRLANQMNQQTLDYNALINPLNVDGKMHANAGQVIANALNQQSYGHKADLHPLNVDNKRNANAGQLLTNTANQQTIDFNKANNPMLLQGNALDNASKINTNTKGYAEAQDAKSRFDTVAVIREALAGNPALLNQFNAQYAIGAKSMGSGNSATPKPSMFKVGEHENAVYNADGTVTPIGVPMGIKNRIRQSLTQFSEDQNTDNEFDTQANDTALWQEVNRLYQGFIAQGMSDYEAEILTDKMIMPQIQNDNDMWNNEYKYVPNNNQSVAPQQQIAQPIKLNSKEEFEALAKGTPYILPNGQQGVK